MGLESVQKEKCGVSWKAVFQRKAYPATALSINSGSRLDASELDLDN